MSELEQPPLTGSAADLLRWYADRPHLRGVMIVAEMSNDNPEQPGSTLRFSVSNSAQTARFANGLLFGFPQMFDRVFATLMPPESRAKPEGSRAARRRAKRRR